MIEIKQESVTDAEDGDGVEARTVAEVRRAGMVGEVAFLSFDRRALLRCRGWPRRSPAATSSTGPPPRRSLRGAREVGSDLVMPEKGMLSDELRGRLQAAGLRVATWVVDDPEELPALARFELYGVGLEPPGRAAGGRSGRTGPRVPPQTDQRVDHQARGQLRVEERALGRHGLARLGHVHDLLGGRAAQEDRQPAASLRHRLLGLGQRVDVAHRVVGHAEQRAQHGLVQEVGVERAQARRACRRAAGPARRPSTRPRARGLRPGEGEGVGPARPGHARRGLGHASRRVRRSKSAARACAASVARRARGQDAVVGQDEQAGRLHGREVAEGPGALRAVGVAVAQGGGVAVVAVGDVGLRAASSCRKAAIARRVGDAPEPVADSAVVGVVRGRRARRWPAATSAEAALGVGEHHEDGAEVGARGQRAPSSGPPWRRRACARGAGPPARSGSSARKRASRPKRRRVRPSAAKRLLEHVERGLGIARASSPSSRQRRNSVARLRVALVPRRAVQDHPHDVARVARVQLVLVGGRDDVVGRGQDLAAARPRARGRGCRGTAGSRARTGRS